MKPCPRNPRLLKPLRPEVLPEILTVVVRPFPGAMACGAGTAPRVPDIIRFCASALVTQIQTATKIAATLNMFGLLEAP
jgi:hypothetical protein